MTSSSGVSTFVLFCFVLVFMLSLKPRAFVQSSFDRFSEYTFCTAVVFSLYGVYIVRSFLPDGVLLPCDHGLDF